MTEARADRPRSAGSARRSASPSPTTRLERPRRVARGERATRLCCTTGTRTADGRPSGDGPDVDLARRWHGRSRGFRVLDDEPLHAEHMRERSSASRSTPDRLGHRRRAGRLPPVMVGGRRPAPRRARRFPVTPDARGPRLMPDSGARALARSPARRGVAVRDAVDPYAWNERALRGWANAGVFFFFSRAVGGTPRTRITRRPWVLCASARICKITADPNQVRPDPNLFPTGTRLSSPSLCLGNVIPVRSSSPRSDPGRANLPSSSVCGHLRAGRRPGSSRVFLSLVLSRLARISSPRYP